MDVDETRTAEVLEGRRTTYRLLSGLYLRPLSDEAIARLAEADFVKASREAADEGLFAEGLYDMGRALRRIHGGTRQLLSTDYTMCFDGMGSVGEEVAVPYASVFVGDRKRLNEEPSHRMHRLLARECMELEAGLDLPKDHLSIQLEFLALLSENAAEALRRGDGPECRRCLEVSLGFLRDDVLNWFPLFYDRALQLLSQRFYRGALRATKGYLELDEGLLAELVESRSEEGRP